MKNRNFIITALLIFFTQGLSWGIWINQPEMKIKLIDKRTKEPIKNALVCNWYSCKRVSFPELTGANYGFKLYRTDDKGEIVIPDYFRITSPFDIFNGQVIQIYSISYLQVLVIIDKDDYHVSLNNYILKSNENGKSIYVNKDNEKNKLIVDEKNKVAIQEAQPDSNFIKMTINLEKSLKYFGTIK